MLKFTAGFITSVTKLFNLSLESGHIPQERKLGHIMLIPKSPNRNSPNDYQVMSLLYILSKVLEHHIHTLLLEYLNTNHPLSGSQWRFRKGRSTVTALLYTTDEWLRILEKGNDVCTIFFFKKAFDSVPQSPLIDKLKGLGLNNQIFKWITNYV